MTAALQERQIVSNEWESLIRDQELDLSPYEAFYRDLHQHPELSLQEYQTAAKVATFLHNLDPAIKIKTAVGGNGLFGIFVNGAGKTLLLRADMDALPVAEKTGLDYASAEEATDSNGKRVSVMHGK